MRTDELETLHPTKKLALGFIGVGWIGRNRMDVLLDSRKADAAMIFEPNGDNLDAALESATDAVIAHTEHELFADPEIDGVVIATPSALHASQCLEALKAGKSVFCQKPLARTAGEVSRIIEASKASDKLLAVDFSYRFTKAFQSVYEVLRNGSIGTVFSVNLVFHNAYGPDKEWFYDISRSGGGCVMDLGIHLVDLALYGLGFPDVDRVESNLFSKGRRLFPGEAVVEDFGKAAIETQDGTSITLECSWNASVGKDAVIEATFYGTDGGVSFRNVNGSFYDFVSERYIGTKTETLFEGQDNWSGQAGVDWARRVLGSQGFDAASANELLETARIIDRIYGR